jgi:hypothetical protein
MDHMHDAAALYPIEESFAARGVPLGLMIEHYRAQCVSSRGRGREVYFVEATHPDCPQIRAFWIKKKNHSRSSHGWSLDGHVTSALLAPRDPAVAKAARKVGIELHIPRGTWRNKDLLQIGSGIASAESTPVIEDQRPFERL